MASIRLAKRTTVMLKDLPKSVVEGFQQSVVAEYATVSSAGIPIDTPTYVFPSADFQTLDIATGLAYPAKAERARKNPRVGLLLEGAGDEPVISVSGHATVLDADLQSNVERYLAETGHMLPGGQSWDVARKAVWYWTRIIVSIAPVTIRWWRTADDMDAKPTIWHAPAGIRYRASDPAPAGKPSAPSNWPVLPWREVLERARSRGAAGHLTLCDSAGYPLPVRVRSWTVDKDGIDLVMPKGVPWRCTGPATLTFGGLETFVGCVSTTKDKVHLHVERALPMHPLMQDPTEVFSPLPNTYENLMRRLREETDRRAQPIPTIPTQRPEPTAGARLRMAREHLVAEKLAGG
jgi:hypothetical protein